MPIVNTATARPRQLIERLLAVGWTQQLLAARLGVAQTTISQIGTGAIEKPNYQIVDGLRELVKRKEKPDKAAA